MAIGRSGEDASFGAGCLAVHAGVLHHFTSRGAGVEAVDAFPRIGIRKSEFVRGEADCVAILLVRRLDGKRQPP